MFYMVLNQKTHRRNDCLFNTNYIHLLIFITKIHLYLQLASSKSWRKSSFITITATKRILEREIILYSISLLDLQKNHFISHASMVRLFLLWFLLCFFFFFLLFFIHMYSMVEDDYQLANPTRAWCWPTTVLNTMVGSLGINRGQPKQDRIP